MSKLLDQLFAKPTAVTMNRLNCGMLTTLGSRSHEE
jgi:hypothetical protein